MVTTKNMATEYVGLVGDDKPTDGASNGSTFLEMNSDASFIFDEENQTWIRQNTGNINPTGAISITSNGTGIDVASYATANVSVPNTYVAGDEGKVVDNGELVAQTSTTKTSNGTYDTTLNNEVEIDVPNTYTAGDEGKVVDNGTLVAQTSTSVSSNNTYDTTLYSSVEVAVPLPSGNTSVSYDTNGEYTVDVTDYESITITVAVTNMPEQPNNEP